MRYMEPKVLNHSKAISLIQQADSPGNPNKMCDIFVDTVYPYPVFCTQNAYAADE